MSLSLVFAGGGTGGHIFPALAIAEALPAGIACHFVCSDKPLDAEILREAGRETGHGFTAIGARPPVAKPKGLVRFLRSWGPSVRAGRALLRQIKGDSADARLVAMGGYVAAPMVQAARAEGVKIVLVNLDAAPGRANRWIARHAERVFTSAAVERPGWERVPPLVRQRARASSTPEACREQLGLDPAVRTLLVTGASQGARSVNRFLEAMLARHRAAFDGWQVLHQTGKDGVEAMREAYAEAGVLAVVRAFLPAMGEAWGAADAAVSRSGAGSVGEVWANRVPTLFLPYPYHADQHQKLNALPLVEAGAVVLAEDRIEPEANMAEAGRALLELLGDASGRARMREALVRLGPADGAGRIARELERDWAGGAVSDRS